jgi:DNA 3'-phosphatase
VSGGKITIKDLKTKIENVVAALGVPVQCFAATGTSVFRKPYIGMWEYLESKVIYYFQQFLGTGRFFQVS